MSVYSLERNIETTKNIFNSSNILEINKKMVLDGLDLLSLINDESIPVSFFDPQYRGVMEKLKYGNEGQRQKLRAKLEQMTDNKIKDFISEIDRTLIPSGHLFLWVDKFHLCEGIHSWLFETKLNIVDLITWNKMTFGMGYRSRRKCEYLLVLQKSPTKAKGVWTRHDIPDVWEEKASKSSHAHPKPIKLQTALIEATTNKGDIVLDPAAGTFSVMDAALICERNFIGCDIN